MLVLQIVIKQWDKSQRTEAHVVARASIPDCYPIISPPAFHEISQHCVIDQHGDDLQGGRVKSAWMLDGKIKFDRFQVRLEDKVIEYGSVTQSGEAFRAIGSLDNQWVQCKYTDRYSVFESDFYYWLYEEVTLNAIWVSEFDAAIFLNNEPALVFEDFKALGAKASKIRP